MKPTLFKLIVLTFSLHVTAQEFTSQNLKTYITYNITNNLPPNIDGILEDSVWDSVEWGGDFY
tara:strand:+ start:16 stop:204 length:189 start_codon:yes stop_codon:yes gene_type:complete